MKHPLLFLLLLLPFAGPGQPVGHAAGSVASTAALDRDNGFGAHHFGDPRGKFSGLTFLLDESPTTQVYQDSAAALVAYGVPLTGYIYKFAKGRLVTIGLDLAGPLNSDRMQAALTAHYGAGRPAPAPLTGRFWQGHRVTLLFTRATRANPAAQAVLSALNP